MYVKTVPFKKNVVDKFYELKQAMKKRSPRGYCEKQVNHMMKVSNRRICGGR
jgi:phage regulator Rha-like protein